MLTSKTFCLLLLFFTFHLYAQRRFGDVELFAGGNFSGPLTASQSVPLNVHKPLIRGLGWQVGALIANKGSSVLKTGLIVINRHYEVNSLFRLNYGSGNDLEEWMIQSFKARYYDLEVPFLVVPHLQITSKDNIGFPFGFIPGFRLYEDYRKVNQILNKDGTYLTMVYHWRSRYNHPGPFNRFSIYLGIKWQHTFDNGRTFFAEPNFRMNIMPFIEGARARGGLTPVGPEDETISLGLNVGMVLKKQTAGINKEVNKKQ